MEQWSLIHNQPLLKTDFTRTGRGGEKEFKLFVDFNLCGPSLNAIKRCQSGYTTESGTIKPHLLSPFSLCQHPKADLRAIVEESTRYPSVLGERRDGSEAWSRIRPTAKTSNWPYA